MAQLNLVVTPDFEADLRRVMLGRGFANKSEALRALVAEEAHRQEENRNRRLEAIDRFRGSVPNDPAHPTDWSKEKDWIYEGMEP